MKFNEFLYCESCEENKGGVKLSSFHKMFYIIAYGHKKHCERPCPHKAGELGMILRSIFMLFIGWPMSVCFFLVGICLFFIAACIAIPAKFLSEAVGI